IHSWWMRERLQSFLDGELPEARRAALAAHLEQCVPCASSLHRMAVCDRLLVSHRPIPRSLSPEASLALLERAMAEARAGRGGPSRGMTLLMWGCAGLLLIAASGAAAWWCRPDRAARSRDANAPRIADHQAGANGAPKPESVFGGGPVVVDTDV